MLTSKLVIFRDFGDIEEHRDVTRIVFAYVGAVLFLFGLVIGVAF